MHIQISGKCTNDESMYVLIFSQKNSKIAFRYNIRLDHLFHIEDKLFPYFLFKVGNIKILYLDSVQSLRSFQSI